MSKISELDLWLHTNINKTYITRKLKKLIEQVVYLKM